MRKKHEKGVAHLAVLHDRAAAVAKEIITAEEAGADVQTDIKRLEAERAELLRQGV